MKIKKILQTLATTLCLSSTAVYAEYIMVVPQAPGSGTSVWAGIVAQGLERHLGEKIVIQHIPGAKDIAGFNEFHNKLRSNDKVIMVSHGGNGVSYLVDKIDYDYKYYDSIGMTNLNIAMGRKVDLNPKKDRIKLAGGSGLEPDGMAVAMLVCGNKPTAQDYVVCWNEKIVWINGVGGGERRLGFRRGEFNVTRESVAAWFKFYSNMPENTLWFHHGLYNLQTGQQADDPNFPAGYQFENVFQQYWGQLPQGEFYEAYKLSRSFRDVLQKALWVNKGNSNTEKLRNALRAMLQDATTMAELEKDTGNYEWMVGDKGNSVVDTLRKNITEKKLQTLVWWHDHAYQFKSVYKPNLVIK
jgi:hypothetical protein